MKFITPALLLFVSSSLFLAKAKFPIRNITSLYYFTEINSTSKIRSAFGGIAPPAPLAP